MSQDILCRKDTVRLCTKPNGYSSQHLPLTVGKTYTIIDFDGSNVVTTTDDPEMEGSYWRGRVQKVSS